MLKSFILTFLIIICHQSFAQTFDYSLQVKNSARFNKNLQSDSVSNQIFEWETRHKKNKFFAGYGVLATEKIGVFYAGYMYDVFKKMTVESSISIYTKNRESVNGMIYFHTYITDNRVDLYLGGGMQALKYGDQKMFRPILSIKADLNITPHIPIGVTLLQPFFSETSYYFIPVSPFIILSLGYKF